MCLTAISKNSRDMTCCLAVLLVHTGLSQNKAEKLPATAKGSNFSTNMSERCRNQSAGIFSMRITTPFTGISKMRFPKHLVLSQSSSILLWCKDSTESVVTGRIFPMLHNLRTKAFCCRMYWKTAFLGRIKATVSQPAIRVPLFITLWNESGVLWWLFLWKR